jgi:EmrB/QacA subfamily drug resistance transporter
MQPESSAAVLESDDEQATRRRFRAVFPGLLLILAIAALDQNIVSTALPRIVGSLGGLSRIAWVVTAFLLCSTVTTPLYGKLSDMYGRRPLFFAAVLIFLLGSVLCGMARSMNALIVFRGLQGLGAGGLITLTQTTIGDFVAPRQRAKYQGYFSAVITLCSIAGPLLGGFITEALSWRWVFYVNVPVGAVALTIIGVGLPPGRPVRKHQVDYPGIILLTLSTSSLLALLGLVGEPEPASPAKIVGFALLAVLGLVGMVLRARVASEPVIPPILFRSRVFVIATLTVALNFLALQAVGLFLPLFFQLVMGMSPSRAGLMTVPLMGGLIVSSIVGGKIVSAIGRYKMLPVVGLALVALADFSLSAVVSGGAVRLSVMLSLIMLIGLGAGLILPILTMAIQNAVDPANLGAATATSIFFRSLGATFGVTLAGAIVNWRVRAALPQAGALAPAHGLPSVDVLAGHDPALLAAYQHGLSAVYLMGGCFVVLAFLCVCLLPEKPLRGGVGKGRLMS